MAGDPGREGGERLRRAVDPPAAVMVGEGRPSTSFFPLKALKKQKNKAWMVGLRRP